MYSYLHSHRAISLRLAWNANMLLGMSAEDYLSSSTQRRAVAYDRPQEATEPNSGSCFFSLLSASLNTRI